MKRTVFPKEKTTKLGPNYSLPTEVVKMHFHNNDWDWKEPQRPYLEMPGEELYKDVIRNEKSNIERITELSPECQLSNIKTNIISRIKITKNEMFKIGELLHSAKHICQQIKISFQDWIKNNFDFSYETAHNFMNVYQQCMGIRDVAIHLPVSVLYKISKPSFPAELRNYLIAQGNLEEISCNHVDRLYTKFKESGYKFESIEIDVKEVNRKYNVFRKTHENVNLCEETLVSLIRTKKKLKFPFEEVDWDNPDEIEPESAEITKMIFKTFIDAIENLKITIKNSKTILDKCYKEIEEIKSTEM